jgi:uncharacterized protein
LVILTYGKGFLIKHLLKKNLKPKRVFPTLYMFKFIVPIGKEDQIAALFPNNEIKFRKSSKGNYISATIKAMMPSSDAILELYERASRVEGVISL